MRELDASNITEEVLGRLDRCPDPRLKQIMSSLVRHLHAFVKDVQVTEQEWTNAIQFLTRTGHMCSDTRQEFILLSDTLGVSTLVDSINNPVEPGTTQSTVLGPFYVERAPVMALGSVIDPQFDERQPLYVDVLVTDPDGKPIPGATADVWHSDEEGFYDIQHSADALACRARFTSGNDGRVYFWTTMPASYPVPHDGPIGEMLEATGRHPWRPAHVHFMISAPGYRRLVTHLFVAGDRYLGSDAVFGVKESLVCDYQQHPTGAAPDGRQMARPYRSLSYRFGLRREKEAQRQAA